MYRFTPCSFDKLTSLRMNYFATLPHPQVLHLEWLVKAAKSYLILKDTTTIGYVVIGKEEPASVLYEFYLVSNDKNNYLHLLNLCLSTFSLGFVFCLSYNKLLLESLKTFSPKKETQGLVFTERRQVNLPETNLNMALATPLQIPNLLLHKDDLYETEGELRFMVNNHMLYLCHENEQFVGCGYVIPITEKSPYRDIGMWVPTVLREEGYGTKIIASCLSLCEEKHIIPVAACDSNNLASRRTLEKNGFVTNHQLFRFFV